VPLRLRRGALGRHDGVRTGPLRGCDRVGTRLLGCGTLGRRTLSRCTLGCGTLGRGDRVGIDRRAAVRGDRGAARGAGALVYVVANAIAIGVGNARHAAVLAEEPGEAGLDAVVPVLVLDAERRVRRAHVIGGAVHPDRDHLAQAKAEPEQCTGALVVAVGGDAGEFVAAIRVLVVHVTATHEEGDVVTHRNVTDELSGEVHGR